MRTKTAQIADPGRFLESNMLLVNAIVGEIGRRRRVRGDALEEFRSLAFLKLVEHNYAVLRQYSGASSLRTYLTVVLQRLLLDHRNREWGRWRASAAAIRLGPTAVRLERLITRDGMTPAEAVASIAPGTDATAYIEFARTLTRRGPVRGTRYTLGEDAVPDGFDASPGPDALIEQRSQKNEAQGIRRFVRDALRALPSQDHLLLTLRFRDGLSVADAARVLKTAAKPLYRRIARILEHLQRQLCTDEMRGALARELAAGGWDELMTGDESGWWRPSNGTNGTGPELPSRDHRMSRRGSPRSVHRRPAA